MSQITLDAVLRSKLPDLTQPVELLDESGRVVARIVPVFEKSKYDIEEPDLTPEELAKRLQEPDYSTKEVLDYLEKL